MAVPILAFLATMGARYGASKAIQMAAKKFGKKALQKATSKMSFTGKNIAKKTKPKTYKDTKVHKETLKIRAALRGRKISTDFGKKAVEHSPLFMLRNLVRDALSKRAVSKATQKTVTKSKSVKHKTELQRVKEQIARDKLKPKVKTPKGKIVGRVRRNYGKWEPVHRKPKKPTKPKKP